MCQMADTTPRQTAARNLNVVRLGEHRLPGLSLRGLSGIADKKTAMVCRQYWLSEFADQGALA